MNVRITPHGAPHRTDLYGGVRRVYSDGDRLFLGFLYVRSPRRPMVVLPMRTVARIALDEEPGDWWGC